MVIRGMKLCRSCNMVKPLDEFYRRVSPSGTSKRRARCIECTKARAEGRHSTPERLRQMREASFKRKYGLTPGQYEEMIQVRDGLCDICKQPETRMREGKLLPLCIDHVDGTKKIRGLLCSNCNVAIGLLKHDLRLVRSAFNYLKGSELPNGSDR